MHSLVSSLPYLEHYDFHLGSVEIEDELAKVKVPNVIRVRGRDSFMMAVTDKFDLIASDLYACNECLHCLHIDRVTGQPAGWHIVQVFNRCDDDVTVEEGNNIFTFEPLFGLC